MCEEEIYEFAGSYNSNTMLSTPNSINCNLEIKHSVEYITVKHSHCLNNSISALLSLLCFLFMYGDCNFLSTNIMKHTNS